MKKQNHILVIDPIAFAGGSKVATQNILKLFDSESTEITILTNDVSSWKEAGASILPVYEPKILAGRNSGYLFFVRQLILVINILLARIRRGKFTVGLGASGPGIDLSLYLAKTILGFKIVQLIHGPVARSRTNARALRNSDRVFFLESQKNNVIDVYNYDPIQNKNLKGLPDSFSSFVNGLSEDEWPTECNVESPTLYWAASLLKWKGLDLLLSALREVNSSEAVMDSSICFIRPEETTLDVTEAPVELSGVTWQENPENLDDIRARSNIFVSTSKNEPFGLSILEAMAAGHAILIPEDGAYWDVHLEHNQNCLKYCPDDEHDLAEKLIFLCNNTEELTRLGLTAKSVAENYQSRLAYSDILEFINQEIHQCEKLSKKGKRGSHVFGQ